MKKRPFMLALLVFFFIFVVFTGSIMLLNNGDKTFTLGEKIGIVEVKGVIRSSRSVIEKLQKFENNKAIKAIVLRINSPGGGVGPSQEIHDEVARIVKKKPIIASMGSVAASGGYYVAVPATKIFANPGTITGSIGVIMEFTNVLKLMNKVGLKSSVVKSGVHKDIGSAVREMTAEEKQLLQGLIDDVYSQFVESVCAGRHLSEKKVRKLADGRIYTGRQALKLGLIDKLGGMQPAIVEAARMVGITGKPNVVYPEKPRIDFIDYVIGKTVTHVDDYLVSANNSGVQLMWSPIK